HRSDLELQVVADRVARGDADARLLQLAESLPRRAEVVHAGLQVAERVVAVAVRLRIDLESRALVRRGHGGARYGCARLVGDGAHDGTVQGLGESGRCADGGGDQSHRRDQRRLPRDANEVGHYGDLLSDLVEDARLGRDAGTGRGPA